MEQAILNKKFRRFKKWYFGMLAAAVFLGFFGGSAGRAFGEMYGVMLLYLAPAQIAIFRRLPGKATGAIYLVNLFLGWTVIGWFVAFVFSLAQPIPMETAGKKEGVG